MVNRVEVNEMESPMAQWGWQLGQGGRDPCSPPWQCIIPWHCTWVTSSPSCTKWQWPTSAMNVSDLSWQQHEQNGKGVVQGPFPFCTHCWMSLSVEASGCVQMLSQSKVWRNNHVPSIKPHQEQSDFILIALLHTVGRSTQRYRVFCISALQLGPP